MKPYDIFSVDRVWKNCSDQRPYIIVDCRGVDIFGCFPISGSCYNNNCFFIDATHMDFAATGLTKSCYIHYTSIYEVRRSEFRRYRGALTNQLLAEFIAAAGL